METIKNYLDNMFANFPKTNEMQQLRENLLNNMEEKYNELKMEGKSENEAIGIVISEFGNIDELVNELGIKSETEYHYAEDDNTPVITMDVACEIIDAKKKGALLTSIGVFIILFGTGVFLFLGGFSSLFSNSPRTQEIMETLSLVPLLILIAIAVGIFIIAGNKTDKYKFIECAFRLDPSAERFLKEEREDYQAAYTAQLIIGVVLCILSPLLLIVMTTISNSDFVSGISLLLLLTLIGFAVALFITSGSKMDTFKQLLQEDEYTHQKRAFKKKSDVIIGAIAAIYWPIITIIYLLWSFTQFAWGISWIIWPISGIFFGGLSGVINIIMNTSDSLKQYN